jgi:hypothetical protein
MNGDTCDLAGALQLGEELCVCDGRRLLTAVAGSPAPATPAATR